MSKRDWKKEIADRNIVFLDTAEKIRKCLNEHKTLITSRCSKTKTGKDSATPKEFYVSDINLNFYAAMENAGFYYGILSDKYGIHFCDEKLDYYDIHPSELTKEKKVELGKIIGEKVSKLGYEAIIFYNTSPLLSLPYFEMLENSGLKIYYVSKLDLFSQLKTRKLF